MTKTHFKIVHQPQQLGSAFVCVFCVIDYSHWTVIDDLPIYQLLVTNYCALVNSLDEFGIVHILQNKFYEYTDNNNNKLYNIKGDGIITFCIFHNYSF